MRRLFVVIAVLGAVAVPAWARYHYQAVTTVDGQGGEAGAITVEAWIDGGKAKILFKESQNPLMGVGSYFLTVDGGKTLYLVNPTEGTYSEWNIDAMLGAVGGVMEAMGGFMKMEISDHKVEKLLEESGGSILGYPTTHYRYRTSYTMEMKVMGMKRGDRHDSVQDIWTTTALSDEGFGIWLQNKPKSTGFETFDKLIEAEYQKVSGFPLKMVERTATAGVKKSGRTATTTTTMEVTMLEETSVPGSTFELDPALEEVPMMPLPGAMPVEEPEEDEEEEGGLFKKLKKRSTG